MRIMHLYRLRPFQHRVIFDVNPGGTMTQQLAPTNAHVTVSHTDPTDGGRVDFDDCSPTENRQVDTNVTVQGLEGFARLCLGLTRQDGHRLLQAQWATRNGEKWSATFPATDFLSDTPPTYCLTALNWSDCFPDAMPPRTVDVESVEEYRPHFLNQETDHLDVKVQRRDRSGIPDLGFFVLWQFVDMLHVPVYLQADKPTYDLRPVSGGFGTATFRIYPAGSIIQATLLNRLSGFENIAHFQAVPFGQLSFRLMMPEHIPEEGWFEDKLEYPTITLNEKNWHDQIANMESQGIDPTRLTHLKALLQTRGIIQ